MFGRIVLILYLCITNNNKMEEKDLIYVSKVIPHIKKYIKKFPVTGMVERENWFQFDYKVKGVRFKNDDYSWKTALFINVEVSDKYWTLNHMSGISEWSRSKYYWSARRRNQYIRSYITEDVKKLIDLFSIPVRIYIGTIKMV